MSSQKIETFIFVDLECSGFEASNKIAEIAMVAVHRDAMKSNGQIPRVLDKLLICVDPEVEIKYKESGLSRDLIKTSGKPSFDKNVGNQIVQFIERQAQPACLIAHNGFEFDYLVLSRQFASIGMDISEIRCGDSLKAFRSIQPGRSGRAPYGLDNLYIRAFGRSQDNSHNAEADAVALMRVVMKAGTDIITWFDRNAIHKLPKYRYETCRRINIY